jgi:hypothetical protein
MAVALGIPTILLSVTSVQHNYLLQIEEWRDKMKKKMFGAFACVVV